MAVVVVLLVALAGQPRARGVEGDPPVVTVETNASIAVEASERAAEGGKGPTRRRSRPTGPTWSFWIYSYVDGAFCRQRITTRVVQRADVVRPYATWETTLPVCPRPPSDDQGRVPDELAQGFWDVRLLPSPVLETVPGFAITGKAVYLQIHGEPAKAFEVDNPLGDDVAITASSTYVVDWGDGSPPRTTTSRGGPWPSGDVTHVYTHTDPATTITVTQRWVATWAAGADGGVLQGLTTSATLTLAVSQLQAVRNR